MKKRIFKKSVAFALSLTLFAQAFPVLNVNANEVTGNGFNLSLSPTIGEGQSIIDMDWDDIDYTDNFSSNTKYFVVRKDLSKNKWELRGNYGKETIRVLNVHPNKTDGDKNSGEFGAWMDNLNSQSENVNIATTTVDFASFNSSPSTYLVKNADETYNYDVVVFGFWDSYGGSSNDISTSTSSYLADFINYGGGVLFGHDTVNLKGTHNNFNSLLDDYMDVVYLPQMYDANDDGTAHNREAWVYSNKISIVKQSSATTYPFDINDQNLTIPLSHTLGQITKSQDDILMKFEKNYYEEDGSGPYFNYKEAGTSYAEYAPKDTDQIYYHGGDAGYEEGWYQSNAYLLMENNVGYIQCGHSSGQTNTAEQMVLANLMYAMTVLYFESNGIDQALDVVPPTMPLYTKKGDDLEFSTTDVGSEYVYRIIAVPVGYDITGNIEGIIEELDDYSATSYDDYKVQFSEPVYTSVPGSYKNYYYTVDEKEKVDLVYDVSNPEMKSVPIGQSLKISEINAEHPITENTYLHIIATDKANNKSTINNINLYELASITQSTVNYVDKNGDALKLPETNYTEKVGATFAPAKPHIEGYVYDHSSPAESIVLSTIVTNNIITHYYNLLYPKKVIGVSHKKYPTPSTQEIEITTISGAEGSTKTFNIPDYENYKFSGYYTLGSATGTEVPVSGTNTSISFNDNTPIYLHYDALEKDAVLKFVDSKTNETITTITKPGNVGDIITFDITDTTDLDLTNLDCYTDGSKITDGSVSIELSLVDSENTKTVYLTPRSKYVIYRGIDFTHSTQNAYNDNTSGSAIIPAEPTQYTFELLDQDTLMYKTSDGQRYTTVPIKEFGDWTPVITDTLVKQIDFANPASIVYINYYKGNKPTEEYSYIIKNIDSLSGDVISTEDEVYKNVIQDPDLNIAPINGHDSTTAGRLVDYKPKNLTVTNPNGIKTTYESDTDINSIMPEFDTENNPIIGQYNVDVNYVPMVNIVAEEVVLDKNSNESTRTKTLSVPYNKTTPYKFASSQSLDDYKVTEILEDGTPISNPESYDFSIVADNYDKSLKITYTPLTYTISVNTYLQNGDNKTKNEELVSNSYRAFNENTSIDAPIYDRYEYVGYEIVGNKDNCSIIETPVSVNETETTRLTFKALSEESYTVNLLYKEVAVVNQEFVDTNGNTIYSPLQDITYVGDNAILSLPTKIARKYNLTKVIYDGVEYTPEQLSTIFGFQVEDSKVIYPVEKDITNFTLIFEEKPAYQIVIDNDDITGGDITVTTNVDDELITGPFYKDDIINIIATPDDGYLFGHWEIIIGDIVIEDIYDPDTTFVMPDGSVDIGVIFVPDKDGDGNPDPVIEEDDDDDDDDTIETIVEPTPDPEPIITPEIPGIDLSGLTEAEINRLYNPYIQGYPDLEVKPNAPIKRSEVMTIIYNLYGEGYQSDLSILDKYSDIDSSKWYANEIAYCLENGLINGYSDGTIRPEENITRAEISAILSKFYVNDNVGDSPFIDIDDSWAKNDINKLYLYGIVNGYADNTFKPNQTTTRAELVTLVNRLIDRPDGYQPTKTYPDLTPDFWAFEDMMNASNGGIKPY